MRLILPLILFVLVFGSCEKERINKNFFSGLEDTTWESIENDPTLINRNYKMFFSIKSPEDIIEGSIDESGNYIFCRSFNQSNKTYTGYDEKILMNSPLAFKKIIISNTKPLIPDVYVSYLKEGNLIKYISSINKDFSEDSNKIEITYIKTSENFESSANRCISLN